MCISIAPNNCSKQQQLHWKQQQPGLLPLTLHCYPANPGCGFLQTLSVPNITHMWSAYASQDKFHILMEYCSGGNLLEQLKAAAAPMAEQQLAAQVRQRNQDFSCNLTGVAQMKVLAVVP
jgi:serine/threonine protein kinase